MWVLISPTRDQTCTPCIGRGSLNQWTAREVLTTRTFITSWLSGSLGWFSWADVLPWTGVTKGGAIRWGHGWELICLRRVHSHVWYLVLAIGWAGEGDWALHLQEASWVCSRVADHTASVCKPQDTSTFQASLVGYLLYPTDQNPLSSQAHNQGRAGRKHSMLVFIERDELGLSLWQSTVRVFSEIFLSVSIRMQLGDLESCSHATERILGVSESKPILWQIRQLKFIYITFRPKTTWWTW